MGIRIAHLKQQGPGDHPSVVDKSRASTLPSHLRFTKIVERTDEIEIHRIRRASTAATSVESVPEDTQDLDESPARLDHQKTDVVPAASAESMLTTADARSDIVSSPGKGMNSQRKRRHTVARSRSVLNPETAESLNTQSSNIPTMKRAFQAIERPEGMTQGDTQVSVLVRCQCGIHDHDETMVS